MTYDKWENLVADRIKELLSYDVDDETEVLNRLQKARELETIAKTFRSDLED